MANSTRTIGIIIASILAVVFIAIAVLISGPLPFHTTTASAESTHDLLVSYASKDTDKDGLPDWEEALYGTDPSNSHSVQAGVTDGEAVAKGLVKAKFATATSTPTDTSSIPGPTAGTNTVTDTFARALFQQYMENRGANPPSAAEIASFVETGFKNMDAGRVTPDAFNAGQVRVSGSGPDALVAYSSAVEKVFTANTVPASQAEVLYFADAVNKNDGTALAKVTAIGNAYAKIARALMLVPVPQEVASAHLAFANSLMHMSEVTLDMAALKTDPLRAMLGLGNYEATANSMVASLSSLQKVYSSEGVTISDGLPGAYFYAALMAATNSLSQPKP